VLTEGHAGLWLLGQNGHLSGDPPQELTTTVNVSVLNSTFQGGHDGLEILGPAIDDEHGEIPRFLAVLAVDGSVFQQNENGLEIVGEGRLEFSVSSCLFERNFPLAGAGGTSLDTPTAGVVVRGMEVIGRLRECQFDNNCVAIIWNPGMSSSSCLDLGHEWGETNGTCFGTAVPTASEPGLNTFIIDYENWNPFTEPFVVLLFHKGTNSDPPIFAAGNTWIPSVQGADSSGCKTGTLIGPVGPPPSWTLGGLSNRNFWILQSGAQVKLSSTCP